MLLNLRTIHRPDTIADAVALLQQPNTYPLYGGAALQRSPRPEVEIGIDVSQLALDYVHDSQNSVRLGAMLTLEQVRDACMERAAQHPKIGGIAAALAADFPETLRHTLRLGDLLMERDPQSLTITLLVALGAILKRVDVDMHFTMMTWLGMNQDIASHLIAHARITRGPQRAAVAFEKVARTPADAPIVGAAAYTEVLDAQSRYTALALCGVADTPIPQPLAAQYLDETGDLDGALDRLRLDPPDDHWGSREYRAEMARVVSRRALQRASEQAEG